jgi:hypothetical protein
MSKKIKILSTYPSGTIKESYREVQIGKVTYRVTSCFAESGDFIEKMENVIIRRAMCEANNPSK